MHRRLIKNSSLEYSKEYQEKQNTNVLLAGLCHDIGHGPFSHAFDKVVE
jgi:HD superfamily phosphohydrolase